MSSLNVLTNLSIIPNLFPFDICSSFATLVSNLISLSLQNFVTSESQTKRDSFFSGQHASAASFDQAPRGNDVSSAHPQIREAACIHVMSC